MNNYSNKTITIKAKVQELLCKEITLIELKGTGLCNDAYYIETRDGNKYIYKQEKTTQGFRPQNTLIVEAAIAQQLYDLRLSILTPKVCFVSENPASYSYVYIEGDMMMNVWKHLSERERINICQKLGRFHAEIGKKFTRDMAKAVGATIDTSTNLHPEVEKDYHTILATSNVPNEFKDLAQKAKVIFDSTSDMGVFQFIHNDSHHENILIRDKEISGIIDFGEALHGEVAKEFSRYIRDYPHYVEYIISAYEEASGNRLSRDRLISNALLSGLIDIVEDYHKGGKDKLKAKKSIATYREMIG